ncbi:FxsA family membrane protein [Streptomyces sp. MUM 178J]|uniref:FxsA family membrane protein n=1 Tax=Streptomyces sp. MUM 178J TaxID=2791991 RepID=UPI001F035725|nr:FxsA family membrane protein [Streptomyces sp. MUM 178J]WRQ78427.1 FxsA family membrane protein [Streptomyces sp. MUM 178J]
MTTGAPTPTAQKRSRPRSLLPLAIAAWLVLEIWLLMVVGRVAGGLTVLLLLVGGAVLGAAVMKRAGRRAFTALTQTLQSPSSAVAPQPGGNPGNGFLMLAGLLLMLPGLISDAAGLLLLIPPLRKSLSRRVRRAAVPGPLGDAYEQARMRRPDGKVVQGEVIRDDPPRSEDEDPPRPPLTK